MNQVDITTGKLIVKRRDGQIPQATGSYVMDGRTVGSIGSGLFDHIFELVNAGEENEYLRIKLPVAGDDDIQALSDTGWLPPGIWESMPEATDESLGGIMLYDDNDTTHYLRGDGTWQVVPSGGISYPGAGIAISNGSGWGTSITDNSATWNALISFPGFGNSGSLACVGNDARLSDSRVASDVYEWAKAATKPSYIYSEVGALASGGTAYDSDRLGGQHDYYYAPIANPIFTGTATIPILQLGDNDTLRQVLSSPNDIVKYDAPGRGEGWYGAHDFYTGYNGTASTLAMRIKNGAIAVTGAITGSYLKSSNCVGYFIKSGDWEGNTDDHLGIAVDGERAIKFYNNGSTTVKMLLNTGGNLSALGDITAYAT